MSCKISCKDRASHGSSPPCISRKFSIHYVEPISHTHFTISGSILRISWSHATSHSGGEISPKSAVRDATQLTASNHSSDLTASNQSSLHQISPVIWCSQLSRKLTYRTLQHTASHCNTLQHTATHCNTLQHIWCSQLSRKLTYERVRGRFAMFGGGYFSQRSVL